VGVWAEAAFTSPRDSVDGYSKIQNMYAQVDVGADYTFENGLYVLAEYYFNRLGQDDPDDYSANDLFYQYMGDMTGFGRHYLMAGLRRNFLEKIDASLFAFTNLTDQSAIIMPSLDYFWSDDVSVRLDIALSAGDRKNSELGSMYHSLSLKAIAYC